LVFSFQGSRQVCQYTILPWVATGRQPAVYPLPWTMF
jgi:hypothetical protein